MKIKVLRAQTNLSQKDFAKRIGLTAQTVQKYESGERNIPDTVAKLMRYEFAEFLPPEERLIATVSNRGATVENEEIKRLRRDSEELQATVKDLEYAKEHIGLLKRTVKALEDQIRMYRILAGEEEEDKSKTA